MKRVFVCEGMSISNNEKIKNEAIKLGEILAINGCTYVQGGCAEGLMGLTLKEFLKYSKNVEFYIPKNYFANDFPIINKLVGESNNKFIQVNSESERLNKIIQCDEIIVMPGGSGTIEELLFCNETKRSKEHNAKLTIVNVDNFFNGLLQQMNDNMKNGLSSNNAIKWEVVDSVDKLSF